MDLLYFALDFVCTKCFHTLQVLYPKYYNGTPLRDRDGHGIPKYVPCPSVVFFTLPGPSVRFRIFLSGEYVCPSYGPIRFLLLKKSRQKTVRPFVIKLRNPYF